MTAILEPESEAKLREREFEENVKAIQEGLDTIDQGRVRPYQEFFAEHRLRYPDAKLLK
jgi:hypothetical protein